MEYKHSAETYRIIGAAMEVYNVLGFGFKEEVYQEALAKEFLLRGIPFEREAQIDIYYKGERLDKFYKADFVCYGKVVVELKALSAIADDNTAQLLNYLKATGKEVGLILNFGAASGLQQERRANFFD